MCCFSTLAAAHSGAWPPHTFAHSPALSLLGGLQFSNSPTGKRSALNSRTGGVRDSVA